VAHQRKNGGALKVALGSHQIEFDGRSATGVGVAPDRANAAEQKLRDEAVKARDEAVKLRDEASSCARRRSSARTVVEAAPDGCWILDEQRRPDRRRNARVLPHVRLQPRRSCSA
jgi:hypothetical protein